jgi:hypothetical protein
VIKVTPGGELHPWGSHFAHRGEIKKQASGYFGIGLLSIATVFQTISWVKKNQNKFHLGEDDE